MKLNTMVLTEFDFEKIGLPELCNIDRPPSETHYRQPHLSHVHRIQTINCLTQINIVFTFHLLEL